MMSVEWLSVKSQSGQELLSFLECVQVCHKTVAQKRKRYMLHIMNKTIVVQNKHNIWVRFTTF